MTTAEAPKPPDASAIKALFYLDSNVISTLAPSDNHWFLDLRLERGVYPVISDVVLHEVRNGKPRAEMALISRFPFLYVSSNEPHFVGTAPKFTWAPLENTGLDRFEALGQLEANLILWGTGNPNAPSLSSLFREIFDEAITVFRQELFDLPEPDIELIRRMSDEFIPQAHKLFDSTDVPPISREEAELAGAGPRQLGGLRPPHIVKQILARGDEAIEGFSDDIAKQMLGSDDLRERVLQVALVLLIAGFARDKRLAKSDLVASGRGARSQAADVKHIAAAITSSAFVTSDRRCARLAYAIYEFLGVPTAVILFDPRDRDGMYERILGAEFWPS